MNNDDFSGIKKLILSSLNEIYFNTTLMLDKMVEQKMTMLDLCRQADISPEEYTLIVLQINGIRDDSIQRICNVLHINFNDFVKLI